MDGRPPVWFLALAVLVAAVQFVIRRFRGEPPVNESPEIPDDRE